MNQIKKVSDREAEHYNYWGTEFQKKGDFDLAVNCYQKAINSNPNDSRFHNNLGIVLHETGKFNEALNSFFDALKGNPEEAHIFYNIGLTFRCLGKSEEAEKYYLKAISLKSDEGKFYNNLGNVLQEQGRYYEAIENYLKALQYNPDDAILYSNIGIITLAVKKLDDSEKYFLKALVLAPNNDFIHYNYSNLLLLKGEFKKGWEEHEYRDTKNKKVKGTIWDGSDLGDKTLKVFAEQGFGDTVQFARFIPLIREKAKKIIFLCQKSLAPLIENSFSSYSNISVSCYYFENLSPDEEYIDLVSLPRILKTDFNSIPSANKYLKCNENIKQKWSGKFKKWETPKIGFVWACNAESFTFKRRSCNFDYFYELIKNHPKFDFFSLQKGNFQNYPENYPFLPNLYNFTREINDFSDTAGLIDNLDLIITIDTSVAHLAGALGKRVWNLVNFSPDWRWFLEREDNPWYPTMKIFRQESSGDWDSVFDKVNRELRSFNTNFHESDKLK